jgi:hypothetical protein
MIAVLVRVALLVTATAALLIPLDPRPEVWV